MKALFVAMMLALLAAVIALPLGAGAQTTAKYEWQHWSVQDQPELPTGGGSSLVIALNNIEALGWEIVTVDNDRMPTGGLRYDVVGRRVKGSVVAPVEANAAECLSPIPGAGWTCVNGGWLPPGYPGSGQ